MKPIEKIYVNDQVLYVAPMLSERRYGTRINAHNSYVYGVLKKSFAF